MPRAHRLQTLLVHAGEPTPKIAGAVVTPIFQSSTFLRGAEATYDAVRYLRLNNSPNHDALHRKLAVLEGTEAAVVTSSGMAAISTALSTVLVAGDHLIAQRCLYGGTHDLVTTDLVRLGIEHTFVDGDDPAQWLAAKRPNTRAFYCEALTNPLLQVADLRGIATFCREHGLVSMIDATFATPVNLRPHELGFDLVLHSATKYLNGHSDLVAGVVAGSTALVDEVRRRLNRVGASLDPHACFLLQRGLKTLSLRMRHHNGAGLKVAEFLAAHPAVARVHYPGLPSHPDHARARELLHGFGGMMSFELKGGMEAADRLLQTVELFTDAPSLGGPESLVTLPSRTSHLGMEPVTRRALGIADALVRISVGLEDAADLIDDLERALR